MAGIAPKARAPASTPRFDSDPPLPRDRYLAAQVIIVSTIFGTRNSMTEPPRFLPMASMSPDLNLSAAIPIKKGVAAIISPGLLHPTLRDISHAFENRLSAFQGPGLNFHRSLLRRLAGG